MASTIIASCGLARADTPHEFAQLELSVALSKNETVSSSRLPLLVHFHGAAKITEMNFHRSGLLGVLVTVNCRGLSSAYRTPFQNGDLFPYLLQHVRQQLTESGQLEKTDRWGQIHVSCFSAGYGAVRELLRHEDTRNQIHSVTAADSIYASIHQRGGQRTVDEADMQPFLTFANLAVLREKQFLLSHSQLPVDPYASTVETAEYLLAQTDTNRETLAARDAVEFNPVSKAAQGNFVVLGFAGSDGEAHMNHLRHIADLWKQQSAIGK